MRTPRRSIRKAIFATLGLALFTVAAPSFANDDPPTRVARLSYLRGDVSFQPSGGDEWVQADLNRPLGTGDHLYTDHDSRVEMEVGAATLRLDAGSSFDILNLDDNIAQAELTGGVMNLHVRRVFEGQSYEVDTPTLAFVIKQPGDYRVDIAPDGTSTMVTVFNGTGDVYGENNASYSVRSGQSYRFHDSALHDYEVLDLPRPDDFDQWVQSRNERYAHAVSNNYVSDDMIGASDLADNGSWSDVPQYGHVWYPTAVDAGWAPYRDGHWAWIDPWGWTWVDNAAWGFAPFHYGRWAYVGNRWGWCPGPVAVTPIYAPALVAFVGGAGWGVGISTGPVGWFPLGPSEVYVPWYHTSRNYFTNVNVHNTTIINNTNITNVYNNYSRGQPISNANYAYRQNAAAVTAVSREAFVGARPVNAARVQINANQLRSASVVSRVGIAPERASFVSANAARARVVPTAQTLDRRVVARTPPPPSPVPVATRIDAIKRNNDQPLAAQEMRRIAAPAAAVAGAAAVGTAVNRGQHVTLVGQNGPKPTPIPLRGTVNPATQTGVQRNVTTHTPVTKGPANNANATVQHGQGVTNNAAATNNGPPSSRFAPHAGQPRTSGDAAAVTGRSTTTTGTGGPNRTVTTDRATVHKSPNQPSNATVNGNGAHSATVHKSPATDTENGTKYVEHKTTTNPSVQNPKVTPHYTPRTSTESHVQQQTQHEYTPRTTTVQPRTVTVSPQPQVQHAPVQQEHHAPPPRDTSKDKNKDKEKDDNGGPGH